MTRREPAGGSSGGAAVALAARFLPIADGSDTGGSLRNPAAFCNVVGLRPSPGRVPFGWQEQGAWTDLGTQGPMARSVDDLALLLSAIAGPDHRVTNVLPDSGESFRTVTPAPLRGLRVAVTEDFGGLPVEPAIRATLRSLGDALADAGAAVTDAAPDLRDADRIFHILRAAVFRARFGPLADAEKAELKDTIRWNTEAGEALTHADGDWVAGARLGAGGAGGRLLRGCGPAHRADHAGAAVRYRYGLGAGNRRETDADLHRVDAELQPDHRHLLPGAVAAVRLCRGPAGGRATDRTHAPGTPFSSPPPKRWRRLPVPPPPRLTLAG